jgi:hypothetical protein
MSKPFFIATAKTKPVRTAEAVDVAARYFVYDLFDVTDGVLGAWHVLGRVVGERRAAVARAVERGWLIVRDDRVGKSTVQSASLTGNGRLLARKGR